VDDGARAQSLAAFEERLATLESTPPLALR
jgi:hypothetical protein